MNQFENYKILQKLGTGIHGTIFKVKDMLSDKIYALKLIHDEKTNEFDTVVKLNKLCDTTLKYYKINDAKNAILMDYIEGDDLFNICETEMFKYDIFNLEYCNSIMKDNKFITYIAKLIDAIKLLHDNNFVHRDIKIENIMITKDDNLFLIDFYTLLYIDKNYEGVNANGTLEYMSPEILNLYIEGNTVPPEYFKPSDIWALGIVIFTLVYISYPFFNCNPKTDIIRYLSFMQQEKIMKFEKIPFLSKLVNSMLNFDYKKRPTIDEVKTDFQILCLENSFKIDSKYVELR